MTQTISLSPSKLNILNECERCFYDAYVLDIPRPRGIFPSLPGGMDGVIKTYFDNYRGSMPLFLKSKIEGNLFNDIQKVKRWRNWRTGMTYEDPVLNVKVIGALDDCLNINDTYAPFDAKTKGSDPKDDGSQYYQTQMDIYSLFLESNGYKSAGFAYLVYFTPNTMKESNSHSMALDTVFNVTPFKIPTSTDRAKEIIERACHLMRGERPKHSDTCEYCQFKIKQ